MIENWREIVLEAPGFHIGVWGLLIGLIFGYVIFRTNYCSMGAISDIENFGDFRRFRAWVLAAAVAMIGVWFLQSNEISNVASSIYLTTNFNILASIAGGLIFGYGMVFAGGCATKNLVRAGSGDLRSLVNLIVLGLFSFMTIGGILGLVRTGIFGPTVIDLAEKGAEDQSVGSIIALLTGGDAASLNMYAMIIIAAIALFWCFKDKGFRSSPVNIIAGLVIGLCVVAAWFLTGLAADDLADVVLPVTSLTFVRPSGDALDYLMRFTALGAPSIGVVTLIGTFLGALIGALMTRRFNFTTFADVADTKRNLYGSALMGIGGIVALGCTVGQAITGVSTLAVGSFITFAAITAGGFIGIKRLNAKLMAEI